MGHQNKHGLHEEAVFVLRRRREIRTGFARRSRLRAPPSKVFSPRLRTAPIRSSALLAYLRWVTKTNTASMRRLFLFYAAGVRFEQGSRGEAACAHRPQKCSRLVSAPPPSEALHCSHISGGSVCAPAVIDLPAIKTAGDADPAAARPGMHPRANAFPTTPARRTTLVKVRL